jgi:hypothetical protein
LAAGKLLTEEFPCEKRRDERLARKDERGHPGRHAEVLRVVAAAELHRVHEEPGDREVSPLGPPRRPAHAYEKEQRAEAQQAEGEAQREEGEGRRVLQAGLGEDIAAAPDGDEIPGEQRSYFRWLRRTS